MINKNTLKVTQKKNIQVKDFLETHPNSDLHLNTYKSDLFKFKNELDSFISNYGFEKSYIEYMNDGLVWEKMFHIKTTKDKSFDELNQYLKIIINHMESFSKNNDLYSLFMDSYIMFD